jgi:hypothetical protein
VPTYRACEDEGTQRCPLGTDRAALETQAADGRGRPLQDTRAVLNESCGSWVLGQCGAKYPTNTRPYPDLPSPVPAVGAGHAGRHLQALAEELHARGKLKLEDAFIDALLRGRKKGLASDPPSAAKDQKKSSLSPMITVFLSPLVSKALPRIKANSSKASLPTVSSIHSRRG